MKRVVFATNNAGKAREAAELFSGIGIDVYTLKDLNMISDPEESGLTFADNARIKAKDVFEQLGKTGELKDTIVLADDSGICIDFLDGKPGTQSARFLGHETPYEQKNAEILRMMKEVPEEKRGAHFHCHMTAVCEDGSVYDVEEIEDGRIAEKAEGNGGFGYDPIFWYPEFGKTGGTLTIEEKNAVSHRAKAILKLKELLCRDQKL